MENRLQDIMIAEFFDVNPRPSMSSLARKHDVAYATLRMKEVKIVTIGIVILREQEGHGDRQK
jgi:hypothetical protein